MGVGGLVRAGKKSRTEEWECFLIKFNRNFEKLKNSEGHCLIKVSLCHLEFVFLFCLSLVLIAENCFCFIAEFKKNFFS